VAPGEAFLLFPSVKQAEQHTREVVALLDEELGELAAARERGVVPVGALERLADLQAALVEQVRAGDEDELPLRREAVVLDASRSMPTPSIIPMRVADVSEWSVALEGGAWAATALGPQGLAYVRVAEGRVEERLARRPQRVSAVLPDPSLPWAIWVTSEERCRREGCAQRATGMAGWREDRQRLEPDAWLAAHPIAEVRDAVWTDAQSVWVAALGSPRGVAVRRFDRPAPRGASAAPALLRPTSERVFDGDGWAGLRWVPGDPPSIAWMEAGECWLAAATGEATPVALGGLGGAARLDSCGTAQGGWLVFGSERGVRVTRMDGQGRALLRMGPRPSARGGVRVVCDEAGGAEVWAAQDGALVRAVCTVAGCGEPERWVDRGVERFDVARFRGTTWVAFSSGLEGPVRVTHADPTGRPVTVLAAPCWSPASGLCGPPRLVADATRLVLAAREGQSARVVETRDGRTWRGLEGLEQP
jgi:hypothetical protein